MSFPWLLLERKLQRRHLHWMGRARGKSSLLLIYPNSRGNAGQTIIWQKPAVVQYPTSTVGAIRTRNTHHIIMAHRRPHTILQAPLWQFAGLWLLMVLLAWLGSSIEAPTVAVSHAQCSFVLEAIQWKSICTITDKLNQLNRKPC